jgi:hypothetical protein
VRGMVDDEPRGKRGGGKREIQPVAWTIGYEGGGVEEARESKGNAGGLSGGGSFPKLGRVKGKSKGVRALRHGGAASVPSACRLQSTRTGIGGARWSWCRPMVTDIGTACKWVTWTLTGGPYQLFPFANDF